MTVPGKVTRMGVTLDVGGRPRRVGTLAWSNAERVAAFEHDPEFLEDPLPISPLRLRPAEGLLMAGRHPFDGLHGVFADSLPDGWGRLLTDRAFAAAGRDRSDISPLDRLSVVGRGGMGAMTYAPESTLRGNVQGVDLDWFAREAKAIQGGAEGEDVEGMLTASGGSAGARPKILVTMRRDRGSRWTDLRIDDGSPTGGTTSRWLLKFASRIDADGSGRVERAFSAMAADAGVAMPKTTLVEGADGTAYFATERFDRVADGGKLHVQTLAAVVGSDFRVPSLDYADLLKATRALTRDDADVAEAFRRMVFNVVAGNRDDHEKNHAFTMDATGSWRLAPAYDLTPSDGPGGEHAMTVAGEGRRPDVARMRSVAAGAGISETSVGETVERVAEALTRWPRHADEAGLDRQSASRAARRIEAMASGALGRRLGVDASTPRIPSRGPGKDDGSPGL